MRDDHQTGAQFAVELEHQLEHLRRVLAVQISRRLIRQHQLGPRYQRAGNGGPLAFAAGELRGTMIQAFGQSDARQQSLRLVLGRPRIHAAHQQRHRHVLERRELGQQMMELVDEAHRMVAQAPALGVI